jgi:CheY-like chemotaxis protein
MSPDVTVAPEATRNDVIGAAPKPLNIMIVEDGQDTAETLGMLLRSLGHAVFIEYDSHTALEAAVDRTYDAFLIDVGLPGMDGIELARQIRLQPQHTHCLLVAITGYGQPQDRQKAIDAGFDHYLVKPVGLRQLNEILWQDKAVP